MVYIQFTPSIRYLRFLTARHRPVPERIILARHLRLPQDVPLREMAAYIESRAELFFAKDARRGKLQFGQVVAVVPRHGKTGKSLAAHLGKLLKQGRLKAKRRR